jgi:hypothetical protein
MAILLNTSHPSQTISADSLDIQSDHKVHVHMHVFELRYGLSMADIQSVTRMDGILVLASRMD